MKTTIDIPDDALREVMAHFNAATKKDAALKAIGDYNRRKRAERVVAGFGTFTGFFTQDEHRRTREGRLARQKTQRK